MANPWEEFQISTPTDKFSRTTLSTDEEIRFQQWIKNTPWYSQFKTQYGEDPDLNTPDYDYRGAWKSGVTPELNPADGKYHWGSVRPDTGEYLKSENHPTFWKQKELERTGVNPDLGGPWEAFGGVSASTVERGETPALKTAKAVGQGLDPRNVVKKPEGALTFMGDAFVPSLAEALAGVDTPSIREPGLLGAAKDVALGIPEGIVALISGVTGFIGGQAASVPKVVEGTLADDPIGGMAAAHETAEKVAASPLVTYQPTTDTGKLFTKPFEVGFGTILGSIDKTIRAVSSPDTPKEKVDERVKAAQWAFNSALIGLPLIGRKIKAGEKLTPWEIEDLREALPPETPSNIATAALEAIRNHEIKAEVAEAPKAKFEGNQSIVEGLLTEAAGKEGYSKGSLNRVAKIVTELEGDVAGMDLSGVKGVGKKSKALIEKLVAERDAAKAEVKVPAIEEKPSAVPIKAEEIVKEPEVLHPADEFKGDVPTEFTKPIEEVAPPIEAKASGPAPGEVFTTLDGVEVKYDGPVSVRGVEGHAFTILKEGDVKGASFSTLDLNPESIAEMARLKVRSFIPKEVAPIVEPPVTEPVAEPVSIPTFDTTTLAKGEGYEIKDKRRFTSSEIAKKVAEKKGEGYEVIQIGERFAVGRYVEPEIPRFESLEVLKDGVDVGSEITKSRALADLDLIAEEGSEFGVAQVGDKYYRTTKKGPRREMEGMTPDMIDEQTRMAEYADRYLEDSEPGMAELVAEEARLKEDLRATSKAPKAERDSAKLAQEFVAWRDRYVDLINEAKSSTDLTIQQKVIAKVQEIVKSRDLPTHDIVADVLANPKKWSDFNKIESLIDEFFASKNIKRDFYSDDLLVITALEDNPVILNRLNDAQYVVDTLAKTLGTIKDSLDLKPIDVRRIVKDIVNRPDYWRDKFSHHKGGSLDNSLRMAPKTITRKKKVSKPADLTPIDDNFATFKSEADARVYQEATGKSGELIQDPMTKEWFIEPTLEGMEDFGWEDGVGELRPERRRLSSDDMVDYGEMSDGGVRSLVDIFNNERGSVDITPLRVAVEKMEQVVAAAKRAKMEVGEFLDMVGMSPEAIAEFKTALAQVPQHREELKKRDPITEGILNPAGKVVHQTIKTDKKGRVKSVLPPIVEELATKVTSASRDNIWGTQEVKTDPVTGREKVSHTTNNVQRYLAATETRINAFRRFGLSEFYRTWRELKHNKEAEFKTLREELKALKETLTKEEREGLAIAAYADMKSGKEALQGMGVVEIPTMNAKQLVVFNRITKLLAELRDRINYVRTHTGQNPIPKLLDKNGKENYIPLMRQMNVLREMGVLEGITTADVRRISAISSDYKGIFNPFAKKRKVSDIPIELDVFRATESYLAYALEEVYLGPLAAQMKELATVKLPIGDLIDAKSGKTFKGKMSLQEHNPALAQLLLKWSDEILGIDRTSSIMAIENPFIRKVLPALGNNLVVGIIGGNLRTLMVQPTALIGVYANVGLPHTLYGLTRMMVERPFKGKESRAYALSKTLTIRNAEIIWSDFVEQMRTGKITGAKEIIAKASFAPMIFIDSLVAEAGWNAGFKYAKDKLGKSEKDAITFADDLVERTQGMGIKGAISPIQASITTKWMTLLQTFGIADFNFVMQDVLGIKNPDITKAQHVSRAFRYMLGMILVGELYKSIGIEGVVPDPVGSYSKAKEEGKGELAALFAAGKEGLEKLPIVGGSAKFGSNLGGVVGEYGNIVPDAVEAFANGLDWENMSERQRTNSALLIGKALGLGFGIPMTNQMVKSIRAAARGGNPMDIILGLYVEEAKKRGLPEPFKVESPL